MVSAVLVSRVLYPLLDLCRRALSRRFRWLGAPCQDKSTQEWDIRETFSQDSGK